MPARPVVCVGELLCDLVSPAADVGLAAARQFVRAPGGAPANVAVGLARLGLPAAFVGCVGDDPFGDDLAAVLRDQGVDASGLQRSPARTTLAFVATRSDGRKEIAFWRNPGADAQLAAAAVPERLVEGARLLHFGSVSLSAEPARESTWAIVKRARAAGVTISYDPNWRPALWPDAERGAAEVRAALGIADVVKVADEELTVVCGTGDLDAALDRLLAGGARLAVITRGADGAVAATAGARLSVPGFAVEVVDTLGAGDAFVAALLAGIATEAVPESAGALAELVRRACAAGALACRRLGAIPALPSAEELREFLRRADG